MFLFYLQVAIELYKHALELKPDDEDAHLGLANVAYATGETEEALSYYHKTIKMHPTSYNALYNLAYVYLEIDQPEKAAELFMELIKYYPYYESGHIGLSRALGAQDTIYLSQAIAAAQSGQFRWINMINFLRSRIDIK